MSAQAGTDNSSRSGRRVGGAPAGARLRVEVGGGRLDAHVGPVARPERAGDQRVGVPGCGQACLLGELIAVPSWQAFTQPTCPYNACKSGRLRTRRSRTRARPGTGAPGAARGARRATGPGSARGRQTQVQGTGPDGAARNRRAGRGARRATSHRSRICARAAKPGRGYEPGRRGQEQERQPRRAVRNEPQVQDLRVGPKLGGRQARGGSPLSAALGHGRYCPLVRLLASHRSRICMRARNWGVGRLGVGARYRLP